MGVGPLVAKPIHSQIYLEHNFFYIVYFYEGASDKNQRFHKGLPEVIAYRTSGRFKLF